MTIQKTAEIIAAIESAGNQYAARYEPSWRYLTPEAIRQCMIAHGCNKATAKIILSTSWGKYQIMGQSIFELAGAHNIFEHFLPDEKVQTLTFMSYLESRRIVYNPETLCKKREREVFARKYNGDINTYSARLITELQSRGYKVELH